MPGGAKRPPAAASSDATVHGASRVGAPDVRVHPGAGAGLGGVAPDRGGAGDDPELLQPAHRGEGGLLVGGGDVEYDEPWPADVAG